MVDTKQPAQHLVAQGRLPALPDGDVWVFVREAARAVGIHANTLRTAVNTGALHAERLTKGTLVLRLSEVRAYRLAATEHRSRAQMKRHQRERVRERSSTEQVEKLTQEVHTLTRLMHKYLGGTTGTLGGTGTGTGGGPSDPRDPSGEQEGA